MGVSTKSATWRGTEKGSKPTVMVPKLAPIPEKKCHVMGRVTLGGNSRYVAVPKQILSMADVGFHVVKSDDTIMQPDLYDVSTLTSQELFYRYVIMKSGWIKTDTVVEYYTCSGSNVYFDISIE